jgi:hypothetical protein
MSRNPLKIKIMKFSNHDLTKSILGLCLFTLLIAGCASPAETPKETVNSSYEIASSAYADLSSKALDHVANMEFEEWGSMLTDDVEFNFPDGDAGTRSVLIGKKAVLDWWNKWKETSGVKSMTNANHVDVPIIAKETLAYTGLTGVMVISYFSNELIINEDTLNLRMNFVAHFNSDSLIDRYYTYYDRTKIVEVMKKNILDSK